MKPVFMLLLGAGLTLGAPATAQRAVTPDDIARLARVEDPDVDPAGQWVAYSVQTTDLDADRTDKHLWMTRWDGSASVQLTGRKGERESKPRFSPDGRYLAFLSGRAAEGDKDGDALWLMPRAGGEGEKLPGIKGSVDDFAWSPDGKRLALIVTDPEPEADAKDGKADGKTDDKAKDRPKPIVIDRFQFKQDYVGYLGKQRQRLWLYDLATRTARRLTTGNFDESLPAWSPDGTRIAFASNRAADPDRTHDSNLFVVTVGDKPAEPKVLTTFEGADADVGGDSYPAWSPDGRSIAYIQGGPVKLIGYGVQVLAVVPSAGGAARVLTPALDRNVTRPVWSPDGQSIRFQVEDDGNVRIAEVAAAGGDVRDVARVTGTFGAMDAGPGGALVALHSNPALPDEVFAIEGGKPRQLSRHNEAWLKSVKLAKVEPTRFASADGTDVHGFLITPPDAPKGRRLPTILYNHGGPQAQFDAGFDIGWQVLAGAGYAIVSTNPRGSTGRGQAFAAALYADWGGPAVPDALAGVDDAVKRGIADPQRLYIGGWSYGGMLTNYVIASDTRFKAAVSGASISNVLAGYGTDHYIRDYETELGTPWANTDVWMKNSYPFYKADRIKTPTLFMVGEKDLNVPALNSEQMYQALSSLKIETQLIVYPGQFHGITRPSFLKDRMERWLAWFKAHGGV